MVKNLPATAGDTGFDPWSRRIPHAPEQLSPCVTTPEACAPGTRAPQQKQQRREARPLQLERSLRLPPVLRLPRPGHWTAAEGGST